MTTDHRMEPTTTTAEAFYDNFADRYDDMIDFEKRVHNETEVLRPLVEGLDLRQAVDMGCGTGVHAMALASLGVDATGIDISEQMLARAAMHAQGKSNVRFIRGDFFAPELQQHSPVDAVFCLGNTLPHIDSVFTLSQVIGYWKSCLSPNGRIILQLLNYDRILQTHDRIVGVRQNDHFTTVRFYDFTEPHIMFNILTIRNDGHRSTHLLQSTPLLPIRVDDLNNAAITAGCGTIDIFGSLRRDEYKADSRDLVAMIG